MQRCPKCGYQETDWPAIFAIVAFATLNCVFILTTDHPPMGLRIVGLAANVTFWAALTWRIVRDWKNRREYLKDHPSAD